MDDTGPIKCVGDASGSTSSCSSFIYHTEPTGNSLLCLFLLTCCYSLETTLLDQIIADHKPECSWLSRRMLAAAHESVLVH